MAEESTACILCGGLTYSHREDLCYLCRQKKRDEARIAAIERRDYDKPEDK